jgi:hypothetical protein
LQNTNSRGSTLKKESWLAFKYILLTFHIFKPYFWMTWHSCFCTRG